MKKQALIFVLFTLSAGIFGQIIHIPEDYPNIQQGINASNTGDTILVAPGTYIENIYFGNRQITVASYYLITYDTSYITQTIIDGNQENTVVRFNDNVDYLACLCGFTIMHGQKIWGGGINCTNSSPVLKNLIIKNNEATSGQGMLEYGYGGGIYCSSSNPRIYDSKIIDNSSRTAGGGIYCSNSSPYLFNVELSNNEGGVYGGGLYCRSESSPRLINTFISYNYAGLGGGISCWTNSNPTIQNVCVANNSAFFGGGAYINQSSPIFINMTFVNNSCYEDGGTLYCVMDANPTIVNSICWNNQEPQIYFSDSVPSNISLTVSYSDIQGGEEGIVSNNIGTVNWLEGNMDDDPQFIGVGVDPYALSDESPCIDAGTPDTMGLNLPQFDILLNKRFWDGNGDGTETIDMGAYEYGSIPVGTGELRLQYFHNNIRVFPNPFNDELSMEYHLAENALISVVIYNTYGQIVKILATQFETKGSHEIQWKTESLPLGIYILSIRTGNQFKSTKIVKIK